MVDRSCEQVRGLLALGERDAPDVDEHLARCESCRAEAEQIDRLVASFLVDAEVEMPPALDRSVRTRLLESATAATQPFSRPSLAASLAVGGLLALTAALAGGLAQTGAAEQGAYLALVIALAYTTLSAAATFPLLIMRGLRRPAREREV